MLGRDYQDIIAGGSLILIGSSAALYAWVFYRLGAMTHMGPGMFPIGLGILLAIIGMLILLPALFRQGPALPVPDIRAFVFVVIALSAFAAAIQSLGLVPAIALVTVASVLADNKLGIVGTAVLAAGLSLMGWLIFSVGLNIPLDAFRSPWR